MGRRDEAIFQRDGETVEGPGDRPSLFEVFIKCFSSGQRFCYENFGQAVCLLSCQSSPALTDGGLTSC